MGTINSALSIAAEALDADQAALNVVANNVANANTTGYTVETPDWKENAPIYVAGIQSGQGVTETGATSQRNLVLQARLDQQQQSASASSARRERAALAGREDPAAHVVIEREDDAGGLSESKDRAHRQSGESPPEGAHSRAAAAWPRATGSGR